MAKKVSVAQPRPLTTADEFVRHKPEAKAEGELRPKRITVDVTEDLHTRIKVACAVARVKLSDAVREVLEQRWPA